MLGGFPGDDTRSAYEANPIEQADFQLFPPEGTFYDDTVLTVATAEALLGGSGYSRAYRRFGRAFSREQLLRTRKKAVKKLSFRTQKQAK